MSYPLIEGIFWVWLIHCGYVNDHPFPREMHTLQLDVKGPQMLVKREQTYMKSVMGIHDTEIRGWRAFLFWGKKVKNLIVEYI